MNGQLLTIAMDGVTIQHAGEILFGIGADDKQRTNCAKTYLDSLESFVFGILYGDKISVSGSLPKVKNGMSPGEKVLDDLKSWDLLSSIDKPKRQLDTILSLPNYRAKIAEDLVNFEPAYMRSDGKSYFHEWIMREAPNYLGSDPTLSNAALQSSAYIFAKDPPYFVDRELQDCFQRQTRLIRGMTEQMRRGNQFEHVSTRAMEEFIARSFLTHMTVYWWYEGEAEAHHGIRLPHVTRSLVRRVSSEHKLQKRLRWIRRTVMQKGLNYLLGTASIRNTDQLLDHLLNCRDLPKFKELRVKIGLLETECRNARTASKIKAADVSAQKLTDEINRLSFSLGDGVEDVIVEPGDQIDVRRTVLYRITSGSQNWTHEYHARLSTVFPELFNGSTTNTFIFKSDIDVTATEDFLAELQRLSQSLNRMATSPEEKATASAIADAVSNFENGNTKLARNNLQEIGVWMATLIGQAAVNSSVSWLVQLFLQQHGFPPISPTPISQSTVQHTATRHPQISQADVIETRKKS